MNDIDIDRDGVVTDLKSSDLAEAVDTSLAVSLSRAEIDTQVATARRYPRQITKVSQTILSLATLDEETAEESMYALPRGGKPIKGPSIRFAEIVKTSYGNCRAAARVVHVDRSEKVVIAEGVFHDLETNSATKAEVRRRIVGRNGQIYSDDMIIVTGNAACSIALRNAILGGVPKALWRKAYAAVESTIAGDIKTLTETREKAIKALANFGVTPEQVFAAIGVAGIEDVSIEHIPTLRGMFAALKNGEATVEEMFFGTTNASSPRSDLADRFRGRADNEKAATNPKEVKSQLVEAGDNKNKDHGTGEAGNQSGTKQMDLGGDAKTDAQLLLSLSDHLFTITEGGMKALRPATAAWREKHGWPSKDDSLNTKKIDSIYAAHSKRLAAEGDAVANAQACVKAVSEIIDAK